MQPLENHLIVGRHLLVELFDCDERSLDDRDYLVSRLTEAAKQANATVLDVTSHHFQPQGVTAIALLAESHISIHTWPEHQYAAVDVFTCGEQMDPEKGIKALEAALDSKRTIIKTMTRGMVQ